MDPLTVAGLVSNILQFLSFSHEVLSTSKEVLSSANGMPLEVLRLRLLVKDIKENTKAVSDLSSSRTIKGRETIDAIVADCERLAEKLLKDLKKFETKHDGIAGVAHAAKVAVAFIWKRKDILELKCQLLELEARLDKWWTQKENERQNSSIQQAIEDLTRQMVSLEARSPAAQLNELHSSLKSCVDSQTKQATELRQLLTARHRSTNHQTHNSWSQNVQEVTSTHFEGLKDTVAQLSGLKSSFHQVKRQESLLRSLQFSSIRRRHGDIHEAHKRTLEWLFTNKGTNFASWLENGRGVYWINGMAGSGKSTLMKFVSHSPRTASALGIWAAGERVVIASHYFWRTGTDMQKSKQGLFQSLLYHIIREVPHIADKICGAHRAGDVWDVAQLKACFGRLAQESLGIKFCLFVDGLDEFKGSGDGGDIVQVVNYLASSPHIKVCTSSRPWPEFLAEWGSSQQRLDVQNFTSVDIERYTREVLAESDKFKKLALGDDRHLKLVQELSKRSAGVWLWVYLAVRDLLRDIRDHEPYEQLLARLNSYPQELNDYFEDIIKRIQPIHRKESAQIFLLAYEAARPMSIKMLPTLMKWEDSTIAIKTDVKPATRQEMHTIYQEWQSRLQNRCRDLIRLTSDDKELPINQYQVDFLHRTVSDFLADHHLKKFRENAPTDFDPNAFLSRLMLICIKLTDVDDFKSRLNFLIAYVDELLLYAWKVEQKSDRKHSSAQQIELLDELDRTMQVHGRRHKNHWTNARDPPQDDDDESWREGGQATFLALATQAHLRHYVNCKLLQDPTSLGKKFGRPILDYALRPERVTPVVLHYNYHYDMPWIDSELVHMLLKQGAEPNTKIRILGNQTPWFLFLISCRKNWNLWPLETKNCAHQTLKLLIQYGANTEVTLPPVPKMDESKGEFSGIFSRGVVTSLKRTTTAKYQQPVVMQQSAEPWVPLQTLFAKLYPDTTQADELILALSEATKRRSILDRMLGWTRWTPWS